MSYYTTVKVVNNDGKAIKAEVTCGGRSRGFTNPDTGEISFDLSSNDSYSVSAIRSGSSRVSSTINGGKKITLRLA